MSISYENLLNFPIPGRRHRFTRTDSAFYALSVGLGQDPLDERQLDFVDPQRTSWALPSMAMVVGYPGFWLANPATGIQPQGVLHGEQTIELHRPLPAQGEIHSRSRVTSLIDRGPGRMALLYSERQLLAGETDELVATCKQTHVLVGQGGFGGPPAPIESRYALPEREPDITVELQTRPEQALLYRLNGDANPIHIDPAAARRAGFAQPILHGMCSAGVITHALLRALGEYDAARLKSIALRFTSPVFPGEALSVDIWRDGSFRARVAMRGKVVVDNGRAIFEEPLK